MYRNQRNRPPSTNAGNHESGQSLSISQLNRMTKQLLEDCFTDIQIEGELSNLSQPGSGHWYFTLKDERSQLRCAMFRGRNMAVRFQPEVGQKLRLTGKISLYEARGDYQFIADTMRPAGEGDLALAFEQLKQKLQAAGWFEQERKQALPETIRHIAVITSATGAAIHDIVSVIERRWPAMRITLLPCLVQGEHASAEISAAINLANALVNSGTQDFDVILCGRGGGSLEDLWAFNEEPVAKAIYDSELPVVSAVGHEVDFSIADFVADVRAATPSAAAELLSPSGDSAWDTVLSYQAYLEQQLSQRIARLRERSLQLQARLRSPEQALNERGQRLDDLRARLHSAQKRTLKLQRHSLAQLRSRLANSRPDKRLSQHRQRLQQQDQRLQQSLRFALAQKQQQLQAQLQLLQSYNPQHTLARGYAIVKDEHGNILRSASEASPGSRIAAQLAEGEIQATVD